MISKIKLAAVLVAMSTAPLLADTFKGKSGPVQIVAPPDWSASPVDKDSDPAIQLVVINSTGDSGVTVLYEPAADLDLTLENYGKTVISQMTGRFTQTSHTQWKPLKVDGHDALQCEFKGIRSNLKLAYLVTVLKTDDSYDQVLAFSRQSRFSDEKPQLSQIINSFKVAPQLPVPKDLPPTIVKGKDGIIQLTLPGTYSSLDSGSKDSQLFAAERRSGCFVEVVTENRKDLTYTLQEYGDKAVKGMLSHSTDGTSTKWKSLKINQDDALESDVTLTVDQTKIEYVVTVIQTPDNFHQVLAWSLASSFKNNRPQLVKIAEGLKEIPHN